MKNKTRYLIFVLLIVVAISSCKKTSDDSTPDPPPPPPPPPTTDTAGPLKSAALFPVGLSIENGLYVNNAAYRATVLREAASVTFGNEMKYGSIVQNNGTYNFTTADALVNSVTGSGIEVFGHVLGWHQQQNGTYLKNFGGIIVPAGAELGSEVGFENGLTGWTIFNAQNSATISATTVPAEVRSGSGAMRVVNPVSNPAEQWKVQVSSTAFTTVPGKQYNISYWVKAAAAGGSIRLSSGPSSPQFQGDQSLGTDWQQVSWTITASLASTTFLFDMGLVANTYFIDDVSVKEVMVAPDGPAVYAKLDEALNNWITTIVTRYKGKVKAWDVINELFTDAGVMRNNQNTPATDNNVFVWSNYMGRDFALKAFQYAKAADPDALLFINDYNLESSAVKLDSLLAYVKELQQRGAKVDGIGSQMHMSINTRMTDIDNMFKKMAATGLKVRISELDIRVNPNDTPGFQFTSAIATTQSDMYYKVVKSYYTNVPAAQRHGITIWGVDDATSWIGTALNKLDFPLLFDANFKKKAAYAGFIKGLKEK
ncbi:MAG: endo-1,4-beta-xylanase [Chitinophagaceae bacterium]